MFDWNDEELANIIWGEAAESDDHIVPYPEAGEDYLNKKEWNQDTVSTKPTEQKSPGTKVDTHGRKLESSSGIEGVSASNLSNNPLTDLSLSKACRIDQDPIGTKVSNELTVNSKYYSPRPGVTTEDEQNFQSTKEGKEQADFVDYGWANIGSFDDLDRIFSNDDPLFGQVSLSDADELWSTSSKDLPNSPIKLFPTVNSQNLDPGVDAQEHVNLEYLEQNEKSSALASGKTNDTGLQELQTGNAILVNSGTKSRDELKEQTDLEKMAKATTETLHRRTDNIMSTNEFFFKSGRQIKPFKSRRKAQMKNEEKMFQDFRGNWSLSINPAGQFNNSLAPVQSSSPSTLSQHRQLQGVESLLFQQTSDPSVHHSFYGSAANSYPVTPLLFQIQPGDLQRQPLHGHDISPGSANRSDKSADGFVKSTTMTPQEKIEKLRRRQQMQAMLAIKKQQQQFKNKVSTTCQSISPKCPQEIQCQNMEKADLDPEEIYTLPALDPKSPLEQDDSSTVSTAVDHYSMEETILCRLQEIISKLDFKIRLCIRDSLFRLAQSAMHRHYANDTSSSNKSSRDDRGIIAKGEISSHCRIAGIPDAEAETNPIDRIVAHLLFHRPVELLGNYSDAPESSVSTKLSYEQQKAGLKSLPMECLPDSSKGRGHISQDGSKSSGALGEAHLIKTSSSDNTLNNGLADDAILEYEAVR